MLFALLLVTSFFLFLSLVSLSFCSGRPVSDSLSFSYLMEFFLVLCHLGCVLLVLVHSPVKVFFVSKPLPLDFAFFCIRKFWLRKPQHPVKDHVSCW